METGKLKKFARSARRSLLEQVTAKLALALSEHSAARRESPKAVEQLEKEIKEHGREQVIERVAYIWFNRFCALRFMDVNRYNRMGVVSPAPEQFQPEMLAEAKMGHIDPDIVPEPTRRQVFALLDGKAPSRDPQGEAYRLLLIAACNFWHKFMPFLFERIADYTELLTPDDLLSENSILTHTREAMTPDACEDVEVIGWLYQFYISEKKDEVFEGLKKNRKITPENIPAATQLFTPHWIVRYLVENSLGRLWMLNHPYSKLAERMDYYIRPEQEETNFLRIDRPEEITVCDPACGSGHMLTYAFDLLYAIYEEEGYNPAEIPEKILKHNLYGIEIDKRAGQLAAFALTMKARARQRRFFEQELKPNICVLENIRFEGDELAKYMDFVGTDLFTAPLLRTLKQFEEADNFGSLIRPEVTDVAEMRRMLKGKKVSEELFLGTTHEKVLKALRQAEYLGRKYHVVVANPPYMGGKNMNGRLGTWVNKKYPESKSDLFSTFIDRNICLAQKRGIVAMITMQSWMFLSSFETLRIRIIEQNTLLAMAHLGPRAFDSIAGEVVMTTAFVMKNINENEYQGIYLRLVDGRSENEKSLSIQEAIQNPNCGWFYRASAEDLNKIPGRPIAYWVSDKIRNLFLCLETFENHFVIKAGISTGKNEMFIFMWHEIKFEEIGIPNNKKYRYIPHNKGGQFRKWMGNWDTILKYSKKHITEMEKNPGFRHDGKEYYFNAHIGWSKITSYKSSFRFYPEYFSFDSAGLAIFSKNQRSIYDAIRFLNSKISSVFIQLLNPTLNVTPQVLKCIPLINVEQQDCIIYLTLYEISKSDWDSYETSWDFTALPLIDSEYVSPPPAIPCQTHPSLEDSYNNLRTQWREMTLEMQRLEEENNRIFIEAYDLQDELTPDVPLKEITLTCNPHYRYGGNKSEEELGRLLLADTMRELVSYAVGCMFGRYALDKPGLILANQGETIADYLEQIPEPIFPADDDNVIPMLDGEWFPDDITERFRKFLRVAFGEEHYEDNLRFVEKALNIKDKRNYSIRTYFLSEFYKDHVKRYKKRPIYWLFSSPKGSFNALIYMHRYRPDTVSVVLNDYLKEFRAKLASRKRHLEALSTSASSNRNEKTGALKEIEKISRMIAEMEDYEHEILYPLATRQVEIDLDDGVKVNYPKLGAALKKIAGLSK